ncbi:Kielin/chordin-like protein [Acipenser ruthenus]|uniref:Kielin/chordin-like protein n=1 Tax=Acipenser ruthenus TaxID=7906 RepID=A0A444U5J4_ACIRT|nr:Kielin/chordin-like protein [Acipenser ruthenus]
MVHKNNDFLFLAKRQDPKPHAKEQKGHDQKDSSVNMSTLFKSLNTAYKNRNSDTGQNPVDGIESKQTQESDAANELKELGCVNHAFTLGHVSRESGNVTGDVSYKDNRHIYYFDYGQMHCYQTRQEHETIHIQLAESYPLVQSVIGSNASCSRPGGGPPNQPVIDLLEALNITRSIKGVSKAKGLEPGIPAWKFRQRVPHLTLPRDYSIYFLSTMQGSIGFHFMAQQAKNLDSTLISFISPTAMKKDGHPLLQLISSTRSNQLRLEYRAVHSMEPATILFPGGTPFSNSKWARMALNLEAHKITLFIDCEESIIFEKNQGEDVLSLILPIDLEITFASMPGNKASKFLGYWQTAEISPSGFLRRPWHCENLSDSLPYSLAEERSVDSQLEAPLITDPSQHVEHQSDFANYQQQQSEPENSPQGPRPHPQAQEELLRRLEEAVDNLSMMLDMVKAQNTDLVARVKYLETCECRRLTCSWEGREYVEGSRWDKDQCTVCLCVKGEVRCSVRGECAGVCEEFTYSGCRGNSNNFESLDACQQRCLLGACCSWEPRVPDAQMGFDQEGYDQYGYSVSDLDRTGRKSLAVNQDQSGPALFGPNSQVFSGLSGGKRFDKYGFFNFVSMLFYLSSCGLISEGYSRHGFDSEGYNRDCYNRHGINWRGENDHLGIYDKNGYNKQGYDRSGFDQMGWDQYSYGRDRDNFDAEGFCFELRWFSGCPVGTAPVTCPDLCSNAQCAGYQEAKCRVHNRGSCFTEWYDRATGSHVMCQGCSYEGNIYNNEESFNYDECTTCVCLNGNVQCLGVQCPDLPCLDQYVPPGKCCPVCRPGCEYEGEMYDNGVIFLSRTNPCMNCSCLDSLVRCSPVQCQPISCGNPFQKPGQCCPSCPACELDGRPYDHEQPFTTLDGCQKCTCVNGKPSCIDIQQCPHTCTHGVKPPFGPCCRDCSSCDFHGQLIPNGMSFVANGDVCERCLCTNGNVVCSRITCPSLDCTAFEKVPEECCPKCRGCVHVGIQHEHKSEWKLPDSPCNICRCLGKKVEPCVSASDSETSDREIKTSAPFLSFLTFFGRRDKFCVRMRGVTPHVEILPSPQRDHAALAVMNGDIDCNPIACPPVHCRNPVQRPGDCCPRCEECEYDSKTFVDGQSFISTVNPCLSCRCSAGQVSCERLDPNCPPIRCSHPAKQIGQCCPSCDMCEYERRIYTSGRVFTPPGSSPCLQCTCTGGNVRCQEEVCPSVQCSNPVIDPQHCCPICKVCVLNGVEFEDGTDWEPDEDPCSTCVCTNGDPVCRVSPCPRITCLHPTKMNSDCCAVCDRCTYNQRIYNNGQDFIDPDRPCQNCRCQDGTVNCIPTVCSPVTCSRPEMKAGQCCPRCPDCMFENRVFVNGEEFPNPLNPCQRCVCYNGHVNCEDHTCPGATCTYPLPGSCCKNNCNGCNYAGKEYPNGAEFPHPTDKCKDCHCINGNVQCLSKRCPPLLCSNPFLTPGECCPQCPAPPAECLYAGLPYKHMERFYDPSEKCRSCICNNGTITCQRRPCAPILCANPILQDCCRTCDGCWYGGKELANGEQFADVSDACRLCLCREGTVSCERRACPAVDCPFPVQAQCCQACEGCNYLGQEYLNGQEFTDPQNQCKRCTCMSGFVNCSPKPCYNPGCTHPISLPGKCCPVCEGCFYNGVVIINGQTFHDPADSCSQCTCRSGSVQCIKRLCSPAPCPHPVVGPCDCPLCDGCYFQGRDYIDGQTFQGSKGGCQECTCFVSQPFSNLPDYNSRFLSSAVPVKYRKPLFKESNGGVTCVSVTCPAVSCRNPTTPPGECCPQCTGICHYLDRVYETGATFDSPADSCSKCTCINEVVTCHKTPCPQQCSHPVPSPACCPSCDRCFYEGFEFSNRQTFHSPSDPCQRCNCLHGNVVCTTVVCPQTTCNNPLTKPGQCCPECPVCSYFGKEYAVGVHWPSSTNDCQECACVQGEVRCSEVRCDVTCSYPSRLPGQCCPLCKDCFFEGVLYSNGEDFTPDNCRQCTCNVMPDGEQHLRCYRKQCPSLVDCPKNHIHFPGSDQCCPTCAQPLSNCTATLVGSEVHATDDPCYTCQCKDLTWICIHQGCLPLSCPTSEQFFSVDSCCPICDECVIEAENRRVSDGESWTDSVDECITCTCNLGHIECHIEECAPVICQDGLVKVKSPGKCCYECQDPDISCMYQGTLYQSNEHWEVDECTTCTCVSGEVHCQTERCPQVSCASDETPALIPGMCCPHCIPRPATCIAFGDPHYRTFDGKMIHFQGACTYVLAEDCEGGDFSIHATNDDRGRKGVSWTKEVTVLIGDVVVQLLQNWVVVVDYQTVTLPFLKEPYIYIERKTNTILLNTNIGVKVLWDGKSHLEVSVPGTYKGHMCGLCGNFNNYPQDDMRIRTGQIVLSEAAFGNSWKVQAENQTNAHCTDGEDIDPCKEAGYRARKEGNAKCKILKSKVFERCHNVVLPEMFFASCVYDLCACGSNGDDCLCDALEAYASECRESGVILQWRSPALCAVGCPQDRGYIFDECGPPCPKTCFNKDVPLGVIEAHCFKPCVPGCQCPAGLVEHESHCIQPEACPKIIYGNI